jgi:hypothetical protein
MFGAPEDATVPKEPTLEEINLKIPRHVRLSDDGRTGLWITLISLSIGLLCLGGLSRYLVRQSQQHKLLNSEGREASARITKIGRGRGADTFYYTFQVDGVDYNDSASDVDAPVYPDVGSHIIVLYLASDPSVNYPKGWGWFDLAYAIFFFIGTIPVYLGVSTAWNLLRDHHLARNGLVTEGTVTLCVPKKIGNNFMVDYEFRIQPDYHAQNDQLIEGSNNDCSDEYKTDAKIKVIYLPHRPARNTSYPLDLWQMIQPKAPDGPFITTH